MKSLSWRIEPLFITYINSVVFVNDEDVEIIPLMLLFFMVIMRTDELNMDLC